MSSRSIFSTRGCHDKSYLAAPLLNNASSLLVAPRGTHSCLGALIPAELLIACNVKDVLCVISAFQMTCAAEARIFDETASAHRRFLKRSNVACNMFCEHARNRNTPITLHVGCGGGCRYFANSGRLRTTQRRLSVRFMKRHTGGVSPSSH